MLALNCEPKSRHEGMTRELWLREGVGHSFAAVSAVDVREQSLTESPAVMTFRMKESSEKQTRISFSYPQSIAPQMANNVTISETTITTVNHSGSDRNQIPIESSNYDCSI